jgi:chemotaxis signal transduction protein
VEALLVQVASARHALPLAAVRETLPLGAVAPLPGAPRAVLGALNLHGEVVVLLDTALLLGAPPLEAPTHAAVAVGRRGAAALAATAQPLTAVLERPVDGDRWALAGGGSAALLAVDDLLDPERVARA